MESRESLPLPAAVLDWMLQSTQVEDGMLAEALVEGFYQGLSRLALVLLGDPASANQISCETIAWAVLNRMQYWNETPLKSWLYMRALRLCRRVLLLRKLQCLLWIIFPFSAPPARRSASTSPAPPFSRFTPDDSQAVLASVQSLLSRRKSRTGFSLSAREIILSGAVLGLVFLLGWLGRLWAPENGIIQTRIVTQLAVVEPERTPLPAVSYRKFIYRVQPGDTLEKIGAKAGVSAELLRNQTGLAEGMPVNPGMLIVIQIPDLPASPSMTTPTQVPTRQVPVSLQEGADLPAVMQRLRESPQLWSTLWADVLVIRYGAASTTGPVIAYHKQVWASQPGQSLVVSGPAAGVPDAMHYVRDRRVTIRHWKAGGYDAGEATGLIEDVELRSFFSDPAWLGGESGTRLVGSETVAGRPALILESTQAGSGARSRAWIDAVMGVILRQQRFDGQTQGGLIEEISVQSIAFNVDFPPQIYDPQTPWPENYAVSYDGKLVPAKMLSQSMLLRSFPGSVQSVVGLPTPDFHLSSSRLYFRPSARPNRQSPETALYADQTLLSYLPLDAGQILSCRRSADGGRIAFLVGDNPNLPFYGSYRLFWLDLTRPEFLNPIPPSGTVGPDYAFSPDSRRLAFFGCPGSLSLCNAYQIEVETNSMTVLLSAAYAGSFTWSPDGEEVAMVGALERSLNSGAWVVQASSGAILYQGPFNWMHLIHPEIPGIANGSLILSWFNLFPPPEDGPEGCFLPGKG